MHTRSTKEASPSIIEGKCLQSLNPKYMKDKIIQAKIHFCVTVCLDRRIVIDFIDRHSPFMRSWDLTTSNLRALRKRSIRESGLSPKRSSTSLARSSPSAALSFIMARRSFSDDARLSSVSFNSSFACRVKKKQGRKWMNHNYLELMCTQPSWVTDFYLLHCVAWQFLAWPKHRPMILHCQMLQLGPHGLLLLWHHTEWSSLHKDKDVKVHKNYSFMFF